MLYRMMVGRAFPPGEECAACGCVHLTSNDAPEYTPCDHECAGDVNIDEVFKPLANYTHDLKDLVTLLLRLNRNDEWRASAMLDIAWGGYENWTASTDDGRSHRDIYDDIWFRKQNERRMKKKRELEGGDGELTVAGGDVFNF